MFCAFHKERLAQGECSACGKPVCSECHRMMNGKIFCVHCLPSGGDVGEKKYRPRQPLLAALLGIFPGLGQVYNGQMLKGFFIFFTSWLVIPWLYGIYDAYAVACQINNQDIDVNLSPALLAGCLMSMVLLFGLFSGGPFFMLRGLPYIVDVVSGQSGQAQAKNILVEIAAAVQSYRENHQQYPEDERDLYFSDIPYLKEMYCGMSRGPYMFECRFSKENCQIIAHPLKDGFPRYQIVPGGEVEKIE